MSNNIYSYFILNKSLNKDSLGLLLDSDLKQKKRYNFNKNIWLNNFLYVKNILNFSNDIINLDDNFKVLKLNNVINNIINFSMSSY